MLQRCVALKIVVANRLVEHDLYAHSNCVYLRTNVGVVIVS